MRGLLVWLPSALLAIDWAKHRREPVWLFVLFCLGPVGAAAYMAYFWESITFPFPLASTFHNLKSSKNARKRCSRCAKVVNRLVRVEDARHVHTMCLECETEIMRRRS